jgi:hypothetical protein
MSLSKSDIRHANIALRDRLRELDQGKVNYLGASPPPVHLVAHGPSGDLPMRASIGLRGMETTTREIRSPAASTSTSSWSDRSLTRRK